nr:uncharacterized protein CTRU02_08881 [Colletotrichum truncatum]KAF6789634.1 hypothetical protein CTRU02_08881 [Colletotrichum truncatum]
MDPFTASFGVFNATYHAVLFSIDVDQVPSRVRRNLELVQRCHRDLQHLIEIRNECLPILEKTTIVLNRVNEIIEAANQGLVEVCELVEKCRPDAYNGKIPLRNRLEWVLFDSKEFTAQEPVISRHHASVLSEMNFLRQMALLAPQMQQQKTVPTSEIREKTKIFDNVALLGSLMGQMALSGGSPQNHSPSQSKENKSASQIPHDSRPAESPRACCPPQQPVHKTNLTHTKASHVNSLNPKIIPHTSSHEYKASYDPSLRPHKSTQPLVQPRLQSPALDHSYNTSLEGSQSSFDLQRQSYLHANQGEHNLIGTSVNCYTRHEASIPHSYGSDPSRQIAPTSPSTPSINRPRESISWRNLPMTSEQAKNMNQPAKGNFGPHSHVSQYVHGAEASRPTPGETTPFNQKYAKPQEKILEIPYLQSRSVILSENGWASPERTHVWASPIQSNATWDTDSSTLESPSPTFTAFDGMSTVTLNTIQNEATSSYDHSFDRSKSFNQSTHTSIPRDVRAQQQTPMPNLAEPLNRWQPTEHENVAQPSLPRSQSVSTRPALVFGSAFDGLYSSRINNPVEPSLRRSQSEVQRPFHTYETDQFVVIGSVPDFLGRNNERHSSVYADSAHYKPTGAVHVYEVDSTPTVKRIPELP